jgi:hypothetical protein
VTTAGPRGRRRDRGLTGPQRGHCDTPVWVLGDADRTWLTMARSSISGGVNLLLFVKVSRRPDDASRAGRQLVAARVPGAHNRADHAVALIRWRGWPRRSVVRLPA